MAPATAIAHEPTSRSGAATQTTEHRAATESTSAPKVRPRTLESLLRNASDDEILGLVPVRKSAQKTIPPAEGPGFFDSSAGDAETEGSDSADDTSRAEDSARSVDDSSAQLNAGELPEALRAALDANPELRNAWQDAEAYRKTFATPAEAQAATALLADLNRMDALFYSRKPEDHEELARSIAQLDPAAFASLAQAIARQTGASRSAAVQPANSRPSGETQPRQLEARLLDGHVGATKPAAPGPSAAQADFFHATNAATVEGVLSAIESQVERLLPEGVSKSARSRVVGEIYRDLDSTLRSNRQLTQQMREAFRSGALDTDHQHAIVSLVTGRARQALPAVAKRVLNEWTSTIVAANHDRRTRQRTAERRVDIAGSGGSGNDGSRGASPRDINYSRMSDADILNL